MSGRRLVLLLAVWTGIIGGTGCLLEVGAKVILDRREAARVNRFQETPEKDFPGISSEQKAFYRARYLPYRVWGYAPHVGRHINIDSEGRRRTPQTVQPGARRIFLFGGSTMLGQGASDAWTIPARLAERLGANRGLEPVECVNFGIGGYVNSQELIDLIYQLERGAAPDIVIFYDGINETVAVAQGSPGDHHNLKRIAGIYEDAQKIGYSLGFGDLIRHLAVRVRERFQETHLVRLIGTGNRSGTSGPSGRPFGQDPQQLESMEAAAASIYLQNFRIASALGERYGFKTLFLWQPTLFDKPALSSQERAVLEQGLSGGVPNPAYRPLWEGIRDRIRNRIAEAADARRNGTARWADLSETFEATADTRFPIDWQHTNAVGNQAVAEAIARLLEESGWLDGRDAGAR
ncbi:MAG: hypothetical protein COV76_01620 [Candidatus Omnitrophica bacterium CG11_big_fil_rev_8_21_14_0_20_64_10]|nr:MAG: hypothetical protein COV76_01620 [Candidatus Omnitrophica bacterium CG11_big_fil_rev_8_21_14_0_20_64_10]